MRVFSVFSTVVVVASRRLNLCRQKRINLCETISTDGKRFTMYSTTERGSPNTLNYRLFFRDAEGPISPFHDIPLYANAERSIFNMVVEVPRWTNAKMEDVKKDKLRFVHNCFPHHGYIWNYGALPQTWENPQCLDESTGCKGDNDPLDVLEIGFRVAKRGEVIQVKVLGVMALIDEGETDWKVITIDVNDPAASKLNDIKDVEEHFPGLIKATHEWFKIYKIPDGKPPNQFAFSGEAKSKDFALKVVEETHKHWESLANTTETVSIERTCVSVESPFRISREKAQDIVNSTAESGPAAPIDPIVDKWYFIDLK